MCQHRKSQSHAAVQPGWLRKAVQDISVDPVGEKLIQPDVVVTRQDMFVVMLVFGVDDRQWQRRIGMVNAVVDQKIFAQQAVEPDKDSKQPLEFLWIKNSIAVEAITLVNS